MPENNKQPKKRNFYDTVVKPITQYLANPISMAIIGFVFSVATLLFTVFSGGTLLFPIAALFVTVLGTGSSLAYSYKKEQKLKSIAKVMKAPVKTVKREKEITEALDNVKIQVINQHKDIDLSKVLFNKEDLQRYRVRGYNLQKGIAEGFNKIKKNYKDYEIEKLANEPRYKTFDYHARKYIKYYVLSSALNFALWVLNPSQIVRSTLMFVIDLNKTVEKQYNDFEQKLNAVNTVYNMFVRDFQNPSELEDKYILSALNKRMVNKFQEYTAKTGADGKPLLDANNSKPIVDLEKVSKFINEISKHKEEVVKSYAKSHIRQSLRQISKFITKNYEKAPKDYYKQVEEFSKKYIENQKNKRTTQELRGGHKSSTRSL